MKRSPYPVFCVALSVLLVCLMLVSVVSAAGTAATPSATVPPVLLACSHAKNPEARFTCSFPDDPSLAIPDGPPYTIRCFDNSSAESNQSIVSWKWDFGDGGTSTDKNPLHTYSEPSRYDIRLTVATFCGEQYSNKSFSSLSIYCSAPQPAFTTNVTEGYAPLAVQVTDNSVRTPGDITRWAYWFDNTHSSTERNPVFTYTTPGTYMINQTVWKDCVQLGSSLYPPATRQIKVNPPLNGSAVNVSNTPPKTESTITPPETPAIFVTAAAPVPVETGAAVPRTGTLSVNTEPAGAQLYIDNILKGTSPSDVPDLSSGPHTLRLERDGYQTMTLQVSITGGQTTTLSTSLLPVPGGIALLPVIALIVIMLGVVGMGIYLYLRQRAENAD